MQLNFGIFFAVFPFLMPYQSLASQVLIFGLFALGFNLLYVLVIVRLARRENRARDSGMDRAANC